MPKNRPAALFATLSRRDASPRKGDFTVKRRMERMGAVVSSAVFFVGAQGCMATRGWVNERLAPMESRLDEVDGKADRALAGLDNLRLERRFVLDMKKGATFGFGSAALTERAKSEIDRFLKQLEETGGGSGAAASRVFLIAGHTDSQGPADYNYELGQRRAERVAGYLVSEKGFDPLQVRVASYGASKPVADNRTLDGRRANRRIEILVYQEKVGTL
jgi:outer membrane protein OmpA-like peptidoglycan-associated protein